MNMPNYGDPTAVPPGGPADNVPHWQVTGVQAGQIGTDATGASVSGHLVSFQLDDGTAGRVFIPDSDWSKPVVRPMIEAAVSTLARVRYMSGGSTG
jgi:hypothetical protein